MEDLTLFRLAHRHSKAYQQIDATKVYIRKIFAKNISTLLKIEKWCAIMMVKREEFIKKDLGIRNRLDKVSRDHQKISGYRRSLRVPIAEEFLLFQNRLIRKGGVSDVQFRRVRVSECRSWLRWHRKRDDSLDPEKVINQRFVEAAANAAEKIPEEGPMI